MERRQKELLGPDGIELFANDIRYFKNAALAERKVGIDPGGQLADKSTPY
jgi:hypothetical protein